MNVICLAIDRLRAAYLGAYGNTWISTPNFDRLAAESVLFDRMTIDTPCLEAKYRSLWQGVHAMCPASQLAGRQALPAILSAAGWKTAILASDGAVANHPLAEGFNERVRLTSSGKAKAGTLRTASSLEETDAANFFAAAGEYIHSAKSPFFLWLHTDTLGRIWDAPLEYRQQYTDEDDPTSGDWADVPNRMLPDSFDPDERVAIAHAYAGQVTAIDQLLGVLLDEIESAGMTESTIVALFSPRGFPLGEHKRIGPCDEALYAELTHVPCVLRLPGGELAARRYQELTQPGDLPATILDLLDVRPWAGETNWAAGRGRSVVPLIRGAQKKGFDRACAVGPENQRSIITPAWSLRVSEPMANESQPGKAELFVKPDDWFEVNEIGDRCPEIVDKLRGALTDFELACQTRQGALSDLPDELVQHVE